ncbi:MAG TPA: hypothetical protein PKN78_07100 [Tenuifilaceae bacterium]|nr:hypothetical protein [Tenuifilaceae bacterium]
MKGFSMVRCKEVIGLLDGFHAFKLVVDSFRPFFNQLQLSYQLGASSAL